MAIAQPNFSNIYATAAKIGELKVMPVADYLRGWGYLSTNEAPPMEYFNYLQNFVDDKVYYLFLSAKIRQSNTEYVKDMIITSPNLSSKYNLLCLESGTTGSVEPNFDNVTNESTIIDGTCKWIVKYRKQTIESVNGTKADINGNVSISSLKNPYKLTIKANGILKTEYDGSAAKEVNIVPSDFKIFDLVYPIGSIYMSTSATNPSTLFSGTVWRALDEGRVLIGANSTYKAGVVGGSTTHTITASNLPLHTHGATVSESTTGAHSHTRGTMNITGSARFNTLTDTISSSGALSGSGRLAGAKGYGDSLREDSNIGITFNAANGWSGNTSTEGNHKHNVSVSIASGGGTSSPASISNMQPYLPVYMWKRVS